MDLVFFAIVTILGLTGVIKNDITIRKAEEAEISQKRRQIENEIIQSTTT